MANRYVTPHQPRTHELRKHTLTHTHTHTHLHTRVCLQSGSCRHQRLSTNGDVTTAAAAAWGTIPTFLFCFHRIPSSAQFNQLEFISHSNRWLSYSTKFLQLLILHMVIIDWLIVVIKFCCGAGFIRHSFILRLFAFGRRLPFTGPYRGVVFPAHFLIRTTKKCEKCQCEKRTLLRKSRATFYRHYR